MKKILIMVLALLTICLSACSFNEKEMPQKKANIVSINVYEEFLEEEIYVGDSTPERFLDVEAEGNITKEDIEFVVNDKEIASIENISIRSGDVYYAIKGLSEGETYVYCKAGAVQTKIIKVVVSQDTAVYDEVLQGFVDSYPWSISTFMDDENMSYLYGFCEDISDVGYSYMDINNDGVTELLLGNMDVSDDVVYDMFTIVNDKVVNVFNSGERYRYYLGSDGYIYFSGSSSAVETYYEKYKFDPKEGEVECIEMVTYDGYYAEELGLIDDAFDGASGETCWFKSSTGDKDDRESISSDTALKITENYAKKYKKPEYTPLSEFGKN